MNSTTTNTTPRIYVASLADYNAGRLVGRWIDADQAPEDLHAEIQDMLRQSQEPDAEEWAIHDYEGFGDMTLSESESIRQLSEAAALIEEHGPLAGDLMGYFGGASGIDDARTYLEDHYCGVFDSLTDYAYQFIQECYAEGLERMGDFLSGYLDYQAIGRDFEMSGNIITFVRDGDLHVFRS